MSRRIAVGSTDGVNIDTHFGKTEIFHIYEIPDNGEPSLVEKRVVQSLVNDECSHTGLDGIIKKLSDVETVLVRQIGEHAADLLATEGITSVSIACPVERAVKRYVQRGKLLTPPVLESHRHDKEYSREDCPMRAMKKI
ncbi:MAG: hypothetical protein LBU13_07035 [Synergistaceae bacterium]|jgi:predicted Fe-Mo cluster-binding NifX family protein|nr:hypothetical protein [Synergistaceae bacterium]